MELILQYRINGCCVINLTKTYIENLKSILVKYNKLIKYAVVRIILSKFLGSRKDNGHGVVNTKQVAGDEIKLEAEPRGAPQGGHVTVWPLSWQPDPSPPLINVLLN